MIYLMLIAQAVGLANSPEAPNTIMYPIKT
jgi:hypothetical protein